MVNENDWAVTTKMYEKAFEIALPGGEFPANGSVVINLKTGNAFCRDEDDLPFELFQGKYEKGWVERARIVEG